MKNVRKFLRCSFCSASTSKCEYLIAGPDDVHICASCVKVCVAMIADARKETEDSKQAVSKDSAAPLSDSQLVARGVENKVNERNDLPHTDGQRDEP